MVLVRKDTFQVRSIGPSFRLAFQLRLLLGSLESSDLRLELVIVTLQCLLLVGNILAVEGGLLSVIL